MDHDRAEFVAPPLPQGAPSHRVRGVPLDVFHPPREGRRIAPYEVLVVESDPLDRGLLERALEEVWLTGKYRVVTSAREALRSLRDDGPPRLVLLDQGLPGREAETILSEAKAEAALRTVPIVVLADRPSAADLARAYGLGAATCFAKPRTLEGVRDLVEMLVFYWFLIARVPARPEV